MERRIEEPLICKNSPVSKIHKDEYEEKESVVDERVERAQERKGEVMKTLL